MGSFFRRWWQLTKGNEFLILLQATLFSVALTKLLDALLPDTALAAHVRRFVGLFDGRWAWVILILLSAAVFHLNRRVSALSRPPASRAAPITDDSKNLPIGLHPLEIRLLKGMKEKGGGPFQFPDIQQMFSRAGMSGVTSVVAHVHLQNAISLGFVQVTEYKGTRAVPVDPVLLGSSLPELQAFYAALRSQQQPPPLQMTTQEYITPFFTLTEKGREVLLSLGTVPENLA